MDQFAQYVGIIGSLITIFSSFRHDSTQGSSTVKHPLLSKFSILAGVYILANLTGILHAKDISTVLMDIGLNSGMNIIVSFGNLIIILALALLAVDIINAAKYKRRLKRNKKLDLSVSTLLISVASVFILCTSTWAANTTFLYLTAMSIVSFLIWAHAYR